MLSYQRIRSPHPLHHYASRITIRTPHLTQKSDVHLSRGFRSDFCYSALRLKDYGWYQSAPRRSYVNGASLSW